MGFSCGIVGLPNVGKSTLFNALTKAGADSANYPFCTIEPNLGKVNVPDERLYKLADMSKSKSIVPTTVDFTDIAGLVAGASQGEGLGNKFLAHIRNVEAIVQVVRIFKDDDVVHIGEVDPVRDIEIINTELMLKDMESLEALIAKRVKLARSGNKEAKSELEVFEPILEKLQEGVLVKNMDLDDRAKDMIRAYQLLTEKELIIVANVAEDEVTSYETNPAYIELKKKADELKCDVIALSAKIEQEVSELDGEEAAEYLSDLGLERSGLERLIIEGYKLLKLITYFTTGEKESRAWTITQNTKAPQAAGKIHTDMERGFIRAETVAYDDFVREGGYAGVKEKGLLRQEGKEYVVKDGDIIIIKFNV